MSLQVNLIGKKHFQSIFIVKSFAMHFYGKNDFKRSFIVKIISNAFSFKKKCKYCYRKNHFIFIFIWKSQYNKIYVQ